jgi:enoyl-CoA hydratase
VQDYSGYQRILVERDGRLLTLTLNRPGSLNAIGDGLHEELEEVFAQIALDKEISVLLLAGAGRSFCAGADMKELERDSDEGSDPVARVAEMMQMARRLCWNMLDIEVPIVAAVQGYALGMGATLALFADVVVAAEDAIFADNHVTAGLVAGDGGTIIWPMLLPLGVAKYYLLTGERIDGLEAARLGMVHKAVPADKLLDEAQAVAERIAQGAPLAVRGTKRAINKMLRERTELLLDTALTLEGHSFLTQDHQEAARAFVEKREPVFKGR